MDNKKSEKKIIPFFFVKKESTNSIILEKFLSRVILTKNNELQIYLICIKELLNNELISSTNLEILKEALTFFLFEKRISDYYYHPIFFKIPSLFYEIIFKSKLTVNEYIKTIYDLKMIESIKISYEYISKSIEKHAEKNDKLFKFMIFLKEINTVYIKEFSEQISEYYNTIILRGNDKEMKSLVEISQKITSNSSEE